MNQVRDWFEQDLRDLQPQGLSPGLVSRLQALAPKPEAATVPQATPAPRPRRFRPNLLMLTAAACLAGALGAIFIWHILAVGAAPARPIEGRTAAAVVLTPSSPIQYSLTPTAVHDEGVWSVGDGLPVRRVRREYIREVHLLDTETGQTYTVQEPTEDVLLVQLEAY